MFGTSELLKVICVRPVFVSECTSAEGTEGLCGLGEHITSQLFVDVSDGLNMKVMPA